jgi:hypothetical protein
MPLHDIDRAALCFRDSLVPAVETGTMNRSASILIQAGFNSRLAAIKVVADTGATFTNGQELRAWLRSADVAAWSARPDWPTPETRAMWLEFTQDFAPRDNRTWSERRYHGNAQWYGAPPPPGRRSHCTIGTASLVLSADGLPIGRLMHPLNANRRGLVRATATGGPGRVDLSYLGPDDLWTA